MICVRPSLLFEYVVEYVVEYSSSSSLRGREKPNPARYGLARSFAPLIDGTPPHGSSAATNITEEERMLRQ